MVLNNEQNEDLDEISVIEELLIKVLHTLMDEHPLEEPEFVLILYSLNTDEKILDYLEWVNSKFDGENFRLDKHKLIGAAVRIGEGESVPF
jgi:hypothetical protein